MKRRDVVRPEDALVVVALFNTCGHYAADADAIAAHLDDAVAAVLVQREYVHRLAVLGAQLEDVTYFDATGELQRALAVGTRIAFDDVAQVFNAGKGAIAAPVGAGQVIAVRVRAADEIGQYRRLTIDEHRDVQAGGTDGPGRATQGALDQRVVGEGQR